MRTLHVLNGDATLKGFRESGLAGDVAVWREMLSEGPVKADVRSDEELWTIRQNWINSVLGDKLQHEQADYDTYVVDEFDKIGQYADYDEVVFWFEHDLFCQINLVFLLACFARVDLGGTQLKQVSIDQHPEVPHFKGLGQLSGTQLAALYPQAEVLTNHELQLAADVWKAYAGPDPRQVEKLLTEGFGKLRFLKEALQVHLRRFPFQSSGLNAIEQQLLTLLPADGLTHTELITQYLHHDGVYGIGDWSVETYIQELIPRFIQPVHGQLQPALSYLVPQSSNEPKLPVGRWVGGYKIEPTTSLRWSEERNRLVDL